MVRADRLVSLVLALQARGRTTALALAEELQVSVRTIYRDLEALSAAGVPVRTESGPGGGCQLIEGYRFPLRGLRPEEAEALLILGVPSVIRELGLDAALLAAQRQIQVTAGLAGPGGPGAALVHLDMPRWFRGQEPVPHLRTLARALRLRRLVALGYQRGDGLAGPAPPSSDDLRSPPSSRSAPPPVPPHPPAVPPNSRAAPPAPPRPQAVPPVPPDSRAAPPAPPRPRAVTPLGLVDKAGTWYLVAAARPGQVAVFRVGRITSARVLPEPSQRPPDFDLAGFWARWSREFAATRPRLPVRLRASPEALAVFPEIFGDDAAEALAAALPPDEQGWRVVTLSFEHERAAAHRLAGFGGRVEVLSPSSVRDLLLATARGILARYGAR